MIGRYSDSEIERAQRRCLEYVRRGEYEKARSEREQLWGSMLNWMAIGGEVTREQANAAWGIDVVVLGLRSG